ncbi:S1 RNA-binding domain-containing protein [Streptomyces sp. MBT65]|uniref:S1 RNA-binding domain-containing protein n=1 Tax=Streptomyces sp. MBT65 TaxID=1488395 RepID=UPI0027D9F4F1|nr:S1 RNA-binding domain-containing protein [Streptomyces sp. MBT65]
MVGQRVTGEVVFHAEYNHQVGVLLGEWAEHEDLLPRFADRVGQAVAGRVSKVAPIGVFVRLADCVEGLVPLTARSESDAFREGQEVSVRIVAVDLERSRILLAGPAQDDSPARDNS